MATKTDANGNIVTFELDTKNTYVGETMAFNINVTTSGIDTSDATAAADDIKVGKTAYVNGELLTGTHEEETFTTEEKTITPTESSQEVTPDEADGLSKVTVSAIDSSYIGSAVPAANGTAATTLTVASNDYITYSSVADGDPLNSGTKTNSGVTTFQTDTHEFEVLADVSEKSYLNSGTLVIPATLSRLYGTCTPGTTDKALTEGLYYVTSAKVAGDADLVAENIKNGTSIFGVTGTYTSDATATADDIVLDKTAYVNGELITGTMPKANGEVGTANTYGNQYITFNTIGSNTRSADMSSTEGIGLVFTVSERSYIDAGNLVIPTTIKELSEIAYTPTTTNQVIDSGVYLTGNQIILGDSHLIAENIAKDVTIFGVTGTFEGGTDTSDATAAEADIASGKTAYVNGTKLTGTLVVQNYYTGAGVPDGTLGEDGDLYFMTSGTTTTGTVVGEVSSTDNTISLTSDSLDADTYTLYYEDSTGTPLDGWTSIGTITTT